MHINKIILLAVWFTFSFTAVIAQQNTTAEFIAQGIKLHDRGDYTGAIAKYKKALLIDKNSEQSNYELASTYFAYKK